MSTRLLLAAGLWAFAAALLSNAVGAQQRAGAFVGSLEDPAIKYAATTPNNFVEDVNRRLRDGAISLTFEARAGYLRSALDALQISPDSQLLVFSKGSLQGRQISEQNPRAIFFSDRVALGWVRGGDLIEVAAHDSASGVVFYTLEQRPDASGPPQFKRAFICLGCHIAGGTLAVPGFLMFSTTRATAGEPFTLPRFVEQSDPLERRFGGWFVTGSTGATKHMGNEAAALDARASRELTSVDGLFDADGYRTLSSDVVAHLVFTHQVGMTNLLTRAGWQARVADPALHPPFIAAAGEEERIALMMAGVAREVVDHLLFVDEAPLAGRVRGQSGFAERFSATGPRDRQGRSLHELDLNRRLMKYPCSYLIHSAAFDALPPRAKDPIYKRLWEVLSGAEREARYQKALSRADRQAIVEILRDTQKDLPSYFRGAIQ